MSISGCVAAAQYPVTCTIVSKMHPVSAVLVMAWRKRINTLIVQSHPLLRGICFVLFLHTLAVICQWHFKPSPSLSWLVRRCHCGKMSKETPAENQPGIKESQKKKAFLRGGKKKVWRRFCYHSWIHSWWLKAGLPSLFWMTSESILLCVTAD